MAEIIPFEPDWVMPVGETEVISAFSPPLKRGYFYVRRR
jgi:hypothetical protein